MILVINEGNHIRTEEFSQTTITIGRDPSNILRLSSKEVSRFHCQIQKVEDGYLITDLNSRNGTLVNGALVKGTYLQNGDSIQLGDVRLIFKFGSPAKNQLVGIANTPQFKAIQQDHLEKLKLQAMERDQLLKLQEFSIDIASLLEMDKLLLAVLESCFELLETDSGFVVLDQKIQAQLNMKFDELSDSEKSFIQSSIQQAYQSKEEVLILPPPSPLPKSPLDTAPLQHRCHILIALKSLAWKAARRRKKSPDRRTTIIGPTARFLGLLYLRSRQKAEDFTPKTRQLMEAIASYASIAITNARLHQMATTDNLTQLYNRGYFEMLLADELKKAKHTRTELALILTDIDHFKKFNDTYGHQIGDEVLRDVAQCIKSILRIDDICARYGGEELVFVLPKTNTEQACAVAEKIRKAVEQQRHTSQNLQVTISLGVAVYPEQADSPASLVKKADQALYRAKADGRNCWRLWEEDFEKAGERMDKLAGILSGDQAKNYRNTQLLLETISLLNSNTELDPLLEKLMDKILEITHADRSILFLADKDGKLAFKKGRTNKGENLSSASHYSQSILRKVFQTGKSLCLIDDVSGNVDQSGSNLSLSMGKFQLSSVMSVPIRVKDTIIGVLYVDSHLIHQEFTDSDLVLLEALTGQVAIALNQARLVEEKLKEEQAKRKMLEKQLKQYQNQIP
ncbi:MAG: diguanylate cyclase [Planctomycetota bacterium]|nr:MAG: diguanylate cyclase [Planctomycetota bacterium]